MADTRIPQVNTGWLRALLPAAAAPVRASARARLLYIDNLRVLMIVLVVLCHLGIGYGAGTSWYYLERPVDSVSATALMMFVAFTQWFAMGTFFLIAGFFAEEALQRKSPRAFMRDRLLRLGVPLLLYELVLSLPLEYIRAVQGYGPPPGSFGGYVLHNVANLPARAGPLWFVEGLLAFSLIYAGGRRFTLRSSGERGREWPLKPAYVLWFVLGVAVVTFGVRLRFSLNDEWGYLRPAFFPQYVGMFAAGILAARHHWLPDLPPVIGRIGRWMLIASLVLLPALLLPSGAVSNQAPFLGGATWQSLVISTWEQAFCVAACITLLALFRSRFDRQGGLARLMSESAFAVYVLHPFVVVPLTYLFRGLGLAAGLKWLLLAPFAVALSFLLGHLARRTWLGQRVL